MDPLESARLAIATLAARKGGLDGDFVPDRKTVDPFTNLGHLPRGLMAKNKRLLHDGRPDTPLTVER